MRIDLYFHSFSLTLFLPSPPPSPPCVNTAAPLINLDYHIIVNSCLQGFSSWCICEHYYFFFFCLVCVKPIYTCRWAITNEYCLFIANVCTLELMKGSFSLHDYTFFLLHCQTSLSCVMYLVHPMVISCWLKSNTFCSLEVQKKEHYSDQN